MTVQQKDKFVKMQPPQSLQDENKQHPGSKTRQHRGIFLRLTHRGNKMLDSWFANLKICGSHLKFKINTGADITVISHKMYKHFWNRPPWMPESTLS